MKKFIFSLTTLSFILTAHAANIVTDFSTTTNPNGQYQYGQEPTLGGTFSLLTTPASGTGYAGFSGSTGFPVIVANTSGTEFTNGSVTYSPTYLNLHPSSNGIFSVLRYIIPTTGSYTFTGAFRGQDTSGTTTDVHILFNNVSAFNSNVAGYGDPSKVNYSLTSTLAANSTVDFAVGFGTDASYFNDSTGLQGTISVNNTSAVPEPASVLLTLGGLAFALIRRKRA